MPAGSQQKIDDGDSRDTTKSDMNVALRTSTTPISFAQRADAGIAPRSGTW
jgi:hypothetical protein